ncbi:MAG TPA: hypothetical protein VLE97_06520 [Gaiellaceae bacterium]|nr:hypothetical protein [Gaiellaceae bacterium]
MTVRNVFYVQAIVDGQPAVLRVPADAPAMRTMTKPSDTIEQPSAKIACVCGECGHEQDSMDRCGKCGSFRTVLLSVVVREFGENWRETCFPTDDSDKETP